jgi:hypothetical protein
VSRCANIGHLVQANDFEGDDLISYDTVDRQTSVQRKTLGVAKTATYTYNYDHSLASLLYPSGRTVTYATDSAGRPSSAQDVANNISYMQGTCANGISSLGVCYAPQGAISSANVGPTGGSTWLNFAASYNDRLQPNRIQYYNQTGSVMLLQYGFADASGYNNGNVMSISNVLDGTRTQQFAYDQLNRLITAESTSLLGRIVCL